MARILVVVTIFFISDCCWRPQLALGAATSMKVIMDRVRKQAELALGNNRKRSTGNKLLYSLSSMVSYLYRAFSSFPGLSSG